MGYGSYHRMSCPARRDGGLCACSELTVPSTRVRIAVREWKPVREGSNIEVPNFRPYTGPSRFPLATGKSKKLYERALATAFLRADDSPGLKVPHVRNVSPKVMLDAFERLLARRV